MTHLDQRRRTTDVDAEFFPQFPSQRFQRRFRGFYLAAGEFPKTGQMDPRLAPCNQDPIPVTTDNADCDMQLWLADRSKHGSEGIRCDTRR